ncbi:carboxypeptidase-like regulatory domain-containing protein [Chryseolinea sp. T2]|uniref:carboxypeptidase-like regulatory domain-containing protein n=1 Tax=Chryseolinea sp. T2 TaxID=3129255 RepID=UPI003077C000
MQSWIQLICILITITVCASIDAYSQRTTVSGIVYDSLTLVPLQYVTVINQTTNNGTASNENGAFKLSVSPGDTILFTMLGYSRKLRVIRWGEEVMVVFLREFALTLAPVTIYSTFKPHGSDQWKSVIEVPGFIRNPAGPGSGYVVETFGPGVSVGGLISKMFKSEKEKKKLNTVREKARQSETYLSVVMSDDTRRYFQKTFSMSDDDYNKFIEQFNISHPEAVFIESREEIMNLMVGFVATRAGEKIKN